MKTGKETGKEGRGKLKRQTYLVVTFPGSLPFEHINTTLRPI